MELFDLLLDDIDTWLAEEGFHGVIAGQDENGEDVRVRVAQIADDLLLLADNPASAQIGLDLLQEYYCRWRLVANPAKCETMVWSDKPGTGGVLGVAPGTGPC
jgi:hypothetical protein